MLKETDFLPVLTHELCHKKSGDHWWGLVRNICCVVHWFNPLVWLAARLSRNDQEMACDEHVIGPLTDEERIRYASTLALNAARHCTPETHVLATGMTMKGRHIKRRLRAIIDGHTSLRWLCAAALCVACAGTLFSFATSEFLPFAFRTGCATVERFTGRAARRYHLAGGGGVCAGDSVLRAMVERALAHALR